MLAELLSRRHPELRGIPGPQPKFPIGNLDDFAHGMPWRTSLDYAERFGPYTLFWIADRPAVFIHDPDAIEQILVSKREYFIKDEPTEAMRPGSTDSAMFVSNGADWAAKRRSDFFSGEGAAAWIAERFEPTQLFVQRKLDDLLPLDHVERFEDILYRLVFDVQSFLAFGRRMRDEDFRRYNHIIDVVDVRMKTNLPLMSPQFYRVRRKWHAAIAELIEANAEQPEGRSLSHMLARRSLLPRAQLVSEMSNVFPGGVFSMTVGIAHALSCLCNDGRELERVRNDLFALRETGPSYATLCENQTLESVVRESLRLYAPAPVFLRTVKADEVEIQGLRLRKGVRIALGMLPLHRDATHWEYPRQFIPTRWTPEVLASNPYGSGYFFPFGRGPRTCGGQELALFVIRSMVYALLSDPRRELDVRMPEAHRYYFGCMMPKHMRATIR